MKKKKILRWLVVFALLGAGGWVTAFFFDSEPDIPPYRTATITRGNVADVVTASGTINPVQTVVLGSQVSGQINRIHVKVNDHVTKGQLLAEIDPSLILAELKQIEASLETSRLSYEQAARDLARTRTLVEKDYLPKVDLERAEQAHLSAKNGYESAQSVVEKARVNLSYTKITSPIDGVVISQEVTDGQTLAATYQTPNLFKIAGDLTKMKIDVNFAESDIRNLKPGMPVRFTVDAFQTREFEGVIDLVNLNANTQSGVVTYSATVAVDNADLALLPGMTAYVNVVLSEVKDVLRVPAAALRFTPPPPQVSGLQKLFKPALRRRLPEPNYVSLTPGTTAMLHLLKNDTLHPVSVTIGKSDDALVAVSGEGIAEGDTVVTGIRAVERK